MQIAFCVVVLAFFNTVKLLQFRLNCSISIYLVQDSWITKFHMKYRADYFWLFTFEFRKKLPHQICNSRIFRQFQEIQWIWLFNFNLFSIFLIGMEALNTNTGNLLTTLLVISSLTFSSPRAINPGNSIKNQVAYKYIWTSVTG